MKKLASIVKSIKNRTGIEVSVFSEDLKYFLADESGKPPVLPDKRDFERFYLSENQKRVFFKFRFSGINYIGSIEGLSRERQNYAFLIVSLIENFKDETDGLPFEETLKRVLSGDISTGNFERFIEENNLPKGPCFALTISFDRHKFYEVSGFLDKKKTDYDLVAPMDITTIAYVKIEGAEDSKNNIKTFAKNLYEEILRATGERVVIGTGTYKSDLSKVNQSYREATLALKINGYLYNNLPIHSYSDYLLIRILEDMPKYKLKEITQTLLNEAGEDLFDDEEMLRTAEAFMENDLNLSETSRVLYAHRNTLMYRFDKIQRATNLDVRRFPDAMTFRILSVIKKIID